MLFRNFKDNSIVYVKQEDFSTDKEYYKYIMELKNINIISKDNINIKETMKNILKNYN